MNKHEFRSGTSCSRKVPSLYFIQRKTSDVNATVRRLIEDALLQRYERRAMLEGVGGRQRKCTRGSREKDGEKEHESE